MRCMWPINEGFTMVYHDHTYTVLTIRPESGEGSKNIFGSGIGDHIPVQKNVKNQTCSDNNNQGNDFSEQSSPYVIFHSGFFRYFASCMRTDENCIEHLLHLCDMWERLLRAKPLSTSFEEYNHNIDVDSRYQRVATIYATSIQYFDTIAKEYEEIGYFTLKEGDNLQDMMENNVMATLKKFPMLMYV